MKHFAFPAAAVLSATPVYSDVAICAAAEAQLEHMGQFDGANTSEERLPNALYVFGIMVEAIENNTSMAQWHYAAFLAADTLIFECYKDVNLPEGTDLEALSELSKPEVRQRYRSMAEENL